MPKTTTRTEFVEITPEKLWDYYDLTIKLPSIAGGVPSDPKLIAAWQAAHWPAGGVPGKSLEDAVAETTELVGPEAPGWNTFVRDKQGHFAVPGYHIKAMLKEAANILREHLERTQPGTTPTYLRARLAEKVFVQERLVPFTPHKVEPDESPEKPIHVMTRMGPRDALKKTDVLHDVELHCTLKVLADGTFTLPLLKTLLNFASENGLGADRSQGMGVFDYTLKPKP